MLTYMIEILHHSSTVYQSNSSSTYPTTGSSYSPTSTASDLHSLPSSTFAQPIPSITSIAQQTSSSSFFTSLSTLSSSSISSSSPSSSSLSTSSSLSSSSSSSYQSLSIVAMPISQSTNSANTSPPLTSSTSTSSASGSSSSDFSSSSVSYAFQSSNFSISANNSSSHCTWSLAPTGSGTAYASSCAYYQNLLYYQTTTDPSMPCVTEVGILQPYIGTVMNTYVTNIVSSFYETTEFCDGIPRAVGAPTSVFTLNATITRAAWTIKTDQEPEMFSKFEATPSLVSLLDPCTIQPQDCAQIWRDWELAYVSVLTKGADSGNIPAYPVCSYATTRCDKCTIYGGNVRLLYFPTSTTENLCPTSVKERRAIPIANATSGKIGLPS
jgi:hypothetical protein